MALIDTCRSNMLRKREELAKLSNDKSKESAKIPSLNQKIISAKNAISRTKSESTIKSKLNEIERAEKDIASVNKKISDIEKKIAQKDKELASEEKKYRAEEDRENKKKLEAEKKRFRESERQMIQVNSTLQQHSRNQAQMQAAIANLQALPETITVLFMASNPTDTNSLRLDEEARAIQEMIRKSEYRDSVHFETRWATRPLDILQSINELNPDIIHFSGHGSDTDELVLQSVDGTHKLVSKEAIVQIMMTSSDRIKLVFFNTCFSYGQAEAVVEHVDASIGMNTSISDEAARVFAAQFYSSIGFGLSLQKSYDQAKAALMLEGISEEDTPQLYTKNYLNADEMFLVKPKQGR